MDEALRRAGHSAAVSLAPAPPDSSSAEIVEPAAELDEYAAEIPPDPCHVDDRLPEPPAVGRSAASDSDIESEMEAMHAISRVLTGLSDAGARARVLRWATESFVEAGLQPACCQRAAASGRLSSNSMLHSFVTDFQQLVRDWHGCFDDPDQPAADESSSRNLEPRT